MKWGYFEVGAYIGTQGEREQVLSDFTLGRLDVGASNLSEAAYNTPLSAILLLPQLSHHLTPRGAPYRFLIISLGPSSSWTRRIV
jgi:hypothetical protein